MFKRAGKEPRFPQTPANRAVNRILTYGLIFFIIYAVYNNSHPTHQVRPLKNPYDNNYSPISWGNYVKTTNLLNGHENVFNFVDHNRVMLELTAEDMQKISNSNDPEMAIYQLDFDRNAKCNSILPELSN